MHQQPTDPTTEVKRLQRCMNDLVSVLALPAVWSGSEPSRILDTFLDALLAMLDLAFVYARVRLDSHEAPIDALRVAQLFGTSHSREEIGQALNLWFGENPQQWPQADLKHLGEHEVSIYPIRMGTEGELGVIVAGSQRSGFPEQTESLVLSVAANQLAIGLQQALRLSEQRLVATELERRVEERTNELAKANAELQLQVGLLQHLPVSTWTLKPDGTPDFVNQVWLDFSGQTLDFVRSHPEAWMAAVHPEDREKASKSFRDGVRSGQGFSFETRSLRALDGTYRWHLNQAVVLRDAEGKVLRFVGTTTDIDDQKRAEDALRASVTNLRQILDGIPGLVCTLNPAGQIDLANRRLLEFFGMALEELNSWGTNGAVHAEDLPRVIEELTHAMTRGTPFDSELRYRRADGLFRWSQTRILPVRDTEGSIIRWFGLITDIDDRKRAEEALRASENDLRKVLDSIPGLVCTLSPAGRIELANQQLLSYFGKTLDEINAWMGSDAIHPDDLAHVIEAHTRSMTTGTPYDFEFRCRRADGVYRWFQARNLPMRDSDGRITGWPALMTDIEDRKRAEEKFRESEYEARLTVDSIPGLIAVLTTSGEVERVNQPLLDYLGKSLEEARQWAVDDTVHPDDRLGYLQAFAQAFATGDPVEYEAVRVRRFDGVYRWLNMRGLPLRDREGQIVRWYFLLTEIDDRKRAEEALRESEYEARLIVDSIPGMVGLTSPTGNLEMVSRQALKFFGKTIEELSEWGTNDTIHPEDLPGVIEAFTRAITTGRPYEFPARFKRADGVYRWLQDRGSPLRDRNGDIVRWYLLITDIDDQKRAEEALRESEHESRLIVDSIPGMIAVLSKNGELERVSQPLLDYFGRTLEECRQWAVDDSIHPDDRPAYLQAFGRSFAAGEPVDYEAIRVRRFDGVYRWLNVRGLPLRDLQGQIVRWYFLLTEIDDRKRAEDELRRSEARHRVVVETASDAVVSIDESGAIILANPATKRIFGYNPEELIGKPLTVLMPGAMRGLHETGFKRYLETGTKQLNWQGTEMTAMRASGEEFPAEVSFGEMTVDQRKVFTGFIRDISEKKRSEEELRHSQAELARMMRVVTIGQLTASIAHEVSQPLAGIIMNASTCFRMLKGDAPNLDGARETAQRTIRDANRASEVISRLRTLFSKKQIDVEPIDLNEAAREVIALLSGELERNNVILKHEFSEYLPKVHGDRVQLQQVILNLLRNASDAMSAIEDRPRQMVLRTELEGEHVRLLVQDSGVGFTPEVADQMFESFYTTKSDGMGVGLSISRSIIEANHGRLWATANEGPGATFAFSIPCQRGPIPQEQS
jgi:PAS domain S-box-containing protein